MAESKEPDVRSNKTIDYPCLYNVNPKRSNKKVFESNFLETDGAAVLKVTSHRVVTSLAYYQVLYERTNKHLQVS